MTQSSGNQRLCNQDVTETNFSSGREGKTTAWIFQKPQQLQHFLRTTLLLMKRETPPPPLVLVSMRERGSGGSNSPTSRGAFGDFLVCSLKTRYRQIQCLNREKGETTEVSNQRELQYIHTMEHEMATEQESMYLLSQRDMQGILLSETL